MDWAFILSVLLSGMIVLMICYGAYALDWIRKHCPSNDAEICEIGAQRLSRQDVRAIVRDYIRNERRAKRNDSARRRLRWTKVYPAG